MNHTRLEIIKAIVTDARSKRVIDELVREVERLQLDKEPICAVCFTRSWTPCPPNTPDCVPDNTGGWMVCGYCQLVKEIERLQKLNEEYRQALLRSGWQEREN